MHREVRNLGGRDVTGGEQPVDRRVRRRCGGVEAGIAGQGEFHCGGGESAPDSVGIRIAHRACQQCAGGLLGIGVRPVGTRQRPLHLGRPLGECGIQLATDQGGFGVDVQPGEHEGGGVAVAADAVQRNLQRWWRRFAPHPADPDPVRPAVGQGDGVEPGGGVRIGVAGAGDLVEQLRGDGSHTHLTTCAGVLGDDRGAIITDLRERQAGVVQVGDVGEKGVIPAGGLRAAFDDVTGDYRPGDAVIVVAAPSEVGSSRADDHRRVGNPPGDHDVGA